MSYNDVIVRSEVAALAREEVEAEIFDAVPQASSVMSLGRRLRDMTKHEKTLPIAENLATAYVVGATTAGSGDTTRIQTSQSTWTNKTIKAAKLGVIIPIPIDVFDDSDFDLWEQIRPQIITAFGQKFDALVYHKATGAAPTDWPDGLQQQCVTNSTDFSLVTAADIFDALLAENGCFDLVEQKGYAPNGVVGALSMKAKMRGLRDSNGQPVFLSDPNGEVKHSLDGEPVLFPRNGGLDPTAVQAVVGDWNQLVYSLRKGIKYDILTQASIHDGSGNLQINLAQDDHIAIKAVMRIGWELPNPPNHVNASTQFPFSTLVA